MEVEFWVRAEIHPMWQSSTSDDSVEGDPRRCSSCLALYLCLVRCRLDSTSLSSSNMSGGFFGFDSALPERRDRPNQSQNQPFSGFTSTNLDQTFGVASNQGEEEDLAVYTWGQGGDLLDGNDDLNDETFGDVGDISEHYL